MASQTAGILLIHENRSVFENEHFHCYTSIPNTENAAILKEQLPLVQRFREITLKPNCNYTVKDQTSASIIIPIYGALEIDGGLIGPGQIGFLKKSYECACMLKNPYEDSNISFIELCVQSGPLEKPCTIVPFDLNSHLNTLVTVPEVKNIPLKIHLGKFHGKISKEILLKNHRILAYNVSGSLEIQERLLFEKDTLFLWNCPKMAFESLSVETIILFLEA